MKKLTILLMFCSLSLMAQVQVQQITIKSSNAATHSLVIADKSLFSQNSTTVTTSPSGFITPLVGEGTRLMWLPTKSAFRVGTVESSNWDATNIGTWSIAGGRNTIAKGIVSTAFGYQTNAIGDYSTALGVNTTSSGKFSVVMGNQAIASGENSTAMGSFTNAKAINSLVIGSSNVITGDPNNTVATDPAFVIGNGIIGYPSNAFTVLKNGKTAIGFDDPESMLHVKNGSSGITAYFPNSNLNVESNANNYISLLNPNTIESGILFGNPISNADGGVIYNNTAASRGLQFRTNGNVTRMTLSGAGNLTVAGSVTASCGLLICSDARYKKNITNLYNSLNNLLRINGVRYDLRQSDFPEKNFSDKNQIGFIAQDLEKIFPEMVFTDEKGFKSVDYARLTPVLVEAVKELSIKIEILEEKVSAMQNLKTRLEKLETLLAKTDKQMSEMPLTKNQNK